MKDIKLMLLGVGFIAFAIYTFMLASDEDIVIFLISFIAQVIGVILVIVGFSINPK
ncbi:MAG: hypothetical protein LUG46_03820 [Erysipelotrichaceae bacterium]|nr:hypothetical protein [Erysipelotrichaceae bacterium]